MAIKGNQMIGNRHNHKKWERNVRTYFNQPAKKQLRLRTRMKKAAKIAPRPLKKLKPIVRCPTIRYQTKVRGGRGFSVAEIKAAKLKVRYARTIGIRVDARRKNKSVESLQANVERLKEYMSRLILISKKTPQHPDTTMKKENYVQVNLDKVMPIKQTYVDYPARVITEEEKNFLAYRTLRRVWKEARLVGIKAKEAAEAESESKDNLLGKSKTVKTEKKKGK